MTPERKAALLIQTRAVLVMTAGTSDREVGVMHPLAEVVEALVLEIVPEVKR